MLHLQQPQLLGGGARPWQAPVWCRPCCSPIFCFTVIARPAGTTLWPAPRVAELVLDSGQPPSELVVLHLGGLSAAACP